MHSLASLRLADNRQKLLLIVILVVSESHSVQLFHQHCIFISQHALRRIVRLLLELESNKDEKRS